MFNEQEKKLMDACDWFVRKMKAKLLATNAAGRTGWDDERWLASNDCRQRLCQRASMLAAGEVDQAIDVANFAMFLAYAKRAEVLKANDAKCIQLREGGRR